MTEDAECVLGFGGLICDGVDPGEVIADCEAYKFKRLNLLKWVTMEMNRWVCLILLGISP